MCSTHITHTHAHEHTRAHDQSVNQKINKCKKQNMKETTFLLSLHTVIVGIISKTTVSTRNPAWMGGTEVHWDPEELVNHPNTELHSLAPCNMRNTSEQLIQSPSGKQEEEEGVRDIYRDNGNLEILLKSATHEQGKLSFRGPVCGITEQQRLPCPPFPKRSALTPRLLPQVCTEPPFCSKVSMVRYECT